MAFSFRQAENPTTRRAEVGRTPFPGSGSGSGRVVVILLPLLQLRNLASSIITCNNVPLYHWLDRQIF